MPARNTNMDADNGEVAIRELAKRFAAAFNAGDVDAMMKNYIPGDTLVVFDVVPRKEYRGADNYRNNWVDFLSTSKAILRSPSLT